jgi:hypothetical protein
MTIGRLTGTTLLERLGRTTVLVAGGATATAGMLLGSLAPSVWATLLGFAVTGLGLANIFPVAIARAGSLAGPAEWPRPPPSGISACSSARPRSVSSDSSVDTPAFRQGRKRTPAEQGNELRSAARADRSATCRFDVKSQFR